MVFTPRVPHARLLRSALAIAVVLPTSGHTPQAEDVQGRFPVRGDYIPRGLVSNQGRLVGDPLTVATDVGCARACEAAERCKSFTFGLAEHVAGSCLLTDKDVAHSEPDTTDARLLALWGTYYIYKGGAPVGADTQVQKEAALQLTAASKKRAAPEMEPSETQTSLVGRLEGFLSPALGTIAGFFRLFGLGTPDESLAVPFNPTTPEFIHFEHYADEPTREAIWQYGKYKARSLVDTSKEGAIRTKSAPQDLKGCMDACDEMNEKCKSFTFSAGEACAFFTMKVSDSTQAAEPRSEKKTYYKVDFVDLPQADAVIDAITNTKLKSDAVTIAHHDLDKNEQSMEKKMDDTTAAAKVVDKKIETSTEEIDAAAAAVFKDSRITELPVPQAPEWLPEDSGNAETEVGNATHATQMSMSQTPGTPGFNSPQTPGVPHSPLTPGYSPQTPGYSPQTPAYSPQTPGYSPQTPTQLQMPLTPGVNPPAQSQLQHDIQMSQTPLTSGPNPTQRAQAQFTLPHDVQSSLLQRASRAGVEVGSSKGSDEARRLKPRGRRGAWALALAGRGHLAAAPV